MSKRTKFGLLIALTFVLVLGLASVAYAASFDCDWNGVNGVDNYQAGVATHWVFTGNTATSATITINYSDGTSVTDAVMDQNGQGSFSYWAPATDAVSVTSATVTYEAEAKIKNCKLTISENTTTTTAEDTTTTTAEDTTTTTEENITTTTAEETTSSTEENITTVTQVVSGRGGVGPGPGTWVIAAFGILMAAGLGWTKVLPLIKGSK